LVGDFLNSIVMAELGSQSFTVPTKQTNLECNWEWRQDLTNVVYEKESRNRVRQAPASSFWTHKSSSEEGLRARLRASPITFDENAICKATRAAMRPGILPLLYVPKPIPCRQA
jgi:hypothetical protein